MAEISKITLPSGTTYDIKDTVARNLAGGGIQLKGATTTPLTDEATTNPITINGASYTAVNQDAVFYGKKEFVFDGTMWHEFGDMSGLGDLAYKDSVSATYTPAGTVSQPTFNGATAFVAHTFTGTEGNVSVSGTTTGSVNVTKGPVSVGATAETQDPDYTPTGTNSSSSISGSVATTYNATASGANGNFTPSGTVSTPTISKATAGSTTTIKNPTSKTVVTDMSVSAPASGTATGELVYCSVSGETLSLSKFIETTGASITTSNVTVKNGDAEYEASQPTFTGTKVYAHHTLSGTAAAQTFTGNGVNLTTDQDVVTGASFTGASMTSTGKFTPSGSVKFTQRTSSQTYDSTIQASGTVTQPTFTGTQATITSD